ncbi:MAG: hypothetical protein CMK27_00500 [Porticoccaceae bacterium]|jgi:hypothetical protein|nr:hypothetical protein [Porticoccaceae bacterium]|tara:strand:- start:28 stop:345 length:318 start_codon:yes stop_codon:yes gene_type:complete
MIKIGDKCHAKLQLLWIDIAGDATTVGSDDFNKMKCCEIHTDCYLYDIQELDGRKYVRTFASYQKKDDIGFGDRNVYPLEVFDKTSQVKINKAWKEMQKVNGKIQ